MKNMYNDTSYLYSSTGQSTHPFDTDIPIWSEKSYWYKKPDSQQTIFPREEPPKPAPVFEPRTIKEYKTCTYSVDVNLFQRLNHNKELAKKMQMQYVSDHPMKSIGFGILYCLSLSSYDHISKEYFLTKVDKSEAIEKYPVLKQNLTQSYPVYD